MGSPDLLLLDEPSLGLAPILVKSIFATIKKINKSGVTILLVEQNARAALKLADRGYVLEVGHMVLEGKAQDLLQNRDVSKAYLGG
jgi:branched-chain amino acid transport system ATP-binding protein